MGVDNGGKRMKGGGMAKQKDRYVVRVDEGGIVNELDTSLKEGLEKVRRYNVFASAHGLTGMRIYKLVEVKEVRRGKAKG